MTSNPRPLAARASWQFAALLALAFAALRVTGVLGPSGLRWLLPLGFVLMMLTPYVLLDAAQRRAMGLALPTKTRMVFVALAAGGAAARRRSYVLAWAICSLARAPTTG